MNYVWLREGRLYPHFVFTENVERQGLFPREITAKTLKGGKDVAIHWAAHCTLMKA